MRAPEERHQVPKSDTAPPELITLSIRYYKHLAPPEPKKSPNLYALLEERKRQDRKRQALICLGATAAQALLGKNFKITQERGRIIASDLAPVVMATIHPSAILRAPDSETREAEFRRFVEDLRKIVRYMKE